MTYVEIGSSLATMQNFIKDVSDINKSISTSQIDQMALPLHVKQMIQRFSELSDFLSQAT